MEQMYEDFAGVYDEFMDNTPYEEWMENIIEFMNAYGISRPVNVAMEDDGDVNSQWEDDVPCGDDIPGEDEERILESEKNLVLDLGCGTGTLTELLAKRGYDMIGVDNAEAMLNIAMEKRMESELPILYLLQDMRELELYSTVGTVISVCDSVNYILEEEELVSVFQLVNNYLYPKGIFIFDFNTDYKYREVIGETTIAENRKDCSFIWENYYDEETCLNEYDVTIFVEEEKDLFRRFEEHHVQRGYSIEQMKELVKRSGMELVTLLDADTKKEVTKQSERVYVVARECGK